MARAKAFTPAYPADWNTGPFTVSVAFAAPARTVTLGQGIPDYDLAVLLAVNCAEVQSEPGRVQVVNANGDVVRDFGPALR